METSNTIKKQKTQCAAPIFCVQTTFKQLSPEVNWTIKVVLISRHVIVSVQLGSSGRGSLCASLGRMPTGTLKDANVLAV